MRPEDKKFQKLGARTRRTSSILITSILIMIVISACFRPVGNYDPWRVPDGVSPQPGPAATSLPGSVTNPTATPQVVRTAVPLSTLTKAPQGPTPTPNSPASLPPLRGSTDTYTVKAGDSLASIAFNHQVSVRQILTANEIEDPNLIVPDQVLTIPPATANEQASGFKIVPDSEIIYGANLKDFNTEHVIRQFNGYLSNYSELVEDEYEMTGSEIVQRVADENAINPRILLALVEYRGHWLTAVTPEAQFLELPLGYLDPYTTGLYKQLSWAANAMARGYLLSRMQAAAVWTLADGTVMRIDPTINPGTAAVQFALSILLPERDFKIAISEEGFAKTYNNLFGFPFAYSANASLPEGLTQPDLALPLGAGDTWYYTGGPHWGWGTGSPWAALDFAPSIETDEYGCFASDLPVLAAAPGTVVRSGYGAVVVDLDGDGSERTGWNLLYMHIATDGRVPLGTTLETGDLIGYASCEGGYSSGTHFHIARLYDGLWVPASDRVPFVLGGWTASSTGNVYDGYLEKDGRTIEAFNGRADLNTLTP